MSAEALAHALGGAYRSGSWWRCRCPVHHSNSATLAVRDGKGRVQVRCFAGCSAFAVMAELGRRELLGGKPAAAPDPEAELAALRNRRRRIEAASWLWQETEPANYLIDTYLGSRLILDRTPNTIRLHRSLRHKEAAGRRPAMVGMVEHAEHDGLVGVHCTYLR